MTLWHPDTCECQITISDDEATRGEVTRHDVRCKIHAARAENHHAVLAENQRKNRALGDIKNTVPGSSPRWAFDADRVVVFTFASEDAEGRPATVPTAAQRGQMQAAANARFGPGKVRV